MWLGALEPREIGRLFGKPMDVEELYSEAVEAWDSCRQQNLVDRTLQFYTELYFQDGILAKVDRASMLHGLEARSPFLDLEVADFARRLPHRLKIRGGITKYLLKKALEPLLPLDIIYRRKKGFGTPVGAWFRSGRLRPRGRRVSRGKACLPSVGSCGRTPLSLVPTLLRRVAGKLGFRDVTR